MQKLILTMIVAVTCLPFLVSKGWLPGAFDYLPEVLALAASVLIIVWGVQSRFQFVRPIYWLLFGGLVVVVICGVLINQVSPGPMFAGLRNYLRALPFFLLPAVLLINEKQLGSQFRLLLAICLLQLPLAWSQRLGTIEVGLMTGDRTFGTLMGSGLLSLFLIAAACVLTGFYLRGKISLRRYVLLFMCFVLPTTINETKITVILLPLALLLTFFFGSASGNRLRNTVLGVVIAAGFLAAFIPIYDHFMQPRWGYGLIDFFLMEGRLERYLIRGTEIGDQGNAGRVDGLLAAYGEMSRDPATLAFGFGIGNASESALGAQYEGAYSRLFEGFPLTSIVYIMLELGLLGLLLVVAIFWQILRDSISLARMDKSAFGAVAVGWTGVSFTVFCGLMYSSPIPSAAISYLYWYFSGVIVARRMQTTVSNVFPESAR